MLKLVVFHNFVKGSRTCDIWCNLQWQIWISDAIIGVAESKVRSSQKLHSHSAQLTKWDTLPCQSNSDAYYFQNMFIHLMMVTNLSINLWNKCSWGCQSHHLMCQLEKNEKYSHNCHFSPNRKRKCTVGKEIKRRLQWCGSQKSIITESCASQLKLVRQPLWTVHFPKDVG